MRTEEEVLVMCGSHAFLFRFTMLYSETPDTSECAQLDQGTQVTLDTIIGKVCVCVCVSVKCPHA